MPGDRASKQSVNAQAQHAGCWRVLCPRKHDPRWVAVEADRNMLEGNCPYCKQPLSIRTATAAEVADVVGCSSANMSQRRHDLPADMLFRCTKCQKIFWADKSHQDPPCPGCGQPGEPGPDDARFNVWEVLRHMKCRELEGQTGLLGSAQVMNDLRENILKCAGSSEHVLLLGETGTGKELAARALHRLSPRCDRPFMTCNCAALPETVIESELFGTVEGAFTGAVNRAGRFEDADGGTIFLDEIGELPPACQAKLYRVAALGEFSCVGENRVRRVDVRIVTATNRELPKEIEAGRFRPELYRRLNVLSLSMPALRVRPEDIGPLAWFFALGSDKARNLLRQPGSLGFLKAYHWPGNVGELCNVVRRAAVFGQWLLDSPAGSGAAVQAAPVQPAAPQPAPAPPQPVTPAEPKTPASGEEQYSGGRKILVVDDDKNLRLLYEQELSDEGYEVILAASGREALEYLKTHRPDLVILDISMPGMDGIETLGKMLAKDRTLPVILNTAYSTYKDNFMTWSADAYVVKSGDLTELKVKIREVRKTRGVAI